MHRLQADTNVASRHGPPNDLPNRPRELTRTTKQRNHPPVTCLSFYLCTQTTPKYFHPRIRSTKSIFLLHHAVALTPTALHIPCKILNPGLLAVAEQSAAHHGLLVHDQEAKACPTCISIPAYRRRGRSIRHRHLPGPPARVLFTTEQQRAKSRPRPRIALDCRNRTIRSVAATRAGRDWQCWCGIGRTEPERSVCRHSHS
jgi:hypothetical protein